MSSELLYQVALTLVPNIGNHHAKALLNHFGKASNVFKASKKELEHLEGIGSIRAESIISYTDFSQCEAELKFIEQYKIQPLFISDKAYPQRLLNCYDSPLLLYYRGNADLNAAKIVSIVGTRKCSAYGKNICEKIIEEIATQPIIIVSGLAFGIDTIAHKAALKNNLQTIGVLAHGLDRIYPPENKTLAKEMAEQGGLLTEYTSNNLPNRQNFPMRNRIVAGICDAVIVIETGIKGGSLITAELANGYNKDVFSIPGRIGDTSSEGCNYLIKNNKASLITSGYDLLNNMLWNEAENEALRKTKASKQKQLFIDLLPDEKLIVDLLQNDNSLHIDELYFKTGLSSSATAAALLMLEMNDIVASLPGKMYKLS